MENISHSLPKRSYAGTGYISHKLAYDDVFGGPPKFGLSTLAPRFEDYAEIFGGFHSVRSSSIPVLDLPVIDEEAGFHFDIRSPDFNYLEVFGDFGGLDFALSYEELVGHSSGGYDSSEAAWSPAESESLSVESDPSASSGKHNNLSNGDHLQSSDDIMLFNVSYHMSNQRSMESIATGSTHVTQLPAISGYAYTCNDVLVSQMSEDERSYSHVSNDLDNSVGRGWKSTGEKLFTKGLSHPSDSDSKHDPNFLEKHGKLKSTLNKPFISISDISLRTKPSGLPPPSRPPPAFAVKNGDSDRPNAKFKAFNDSTFEGNDSSSLFFDVEVDSFSSAKAMKDATEKAQTKESVERNEGLQSHIKLHLDNDIELERKTSKTLNVNNRFKDQRMPQSHAKEAKVPKPFAEEKRSLTENNKVVSDSIDGKNHIRLVEKPVNTVAWSEATDLFEVIDTSLPRRASKIEDDNILVENMRSRSNRQQEKVDTEVYDLMEDCKNNKVAKEAPKWDEDRNQLEMDMDICDWDYNQGRLVATKKSSGQEHEDEVQLDEMICKFDFIERKTKVVQQHGRSEKVLVDPDESVDKLTAAWCYLNEVEALQKVKAGTKRIESERMYKDARSMKEKGMRLKENIEREECERRLEEAVELTEPGKRAREKLEQEEREKQQQNACEKEENYKNKLSRERKEKNNTPKETFDPKGNEKILEGAVKHERSDKNSNVGLGKGKKCRDEQLDSKAWGENERLVEAHKQEENEVERRWIAQSKNSKKDQQGDHESQEIKERLSDAYGREESEIEHKEFWTQKDDNRSVMIFKEEEIVKRSQAACDIERNENLSEDTGTWDELSEQDIEIELTEGNGHEGEVRNHQETDVFMEAGNFEAFDGGCKFNEGTLLETLVTRKHDSPGELEATRTAIASEENTKFVTEIKSSDSESNDRTNLPFKGKFNSSSQNRDDLQDENGENNFTVSPCLPERIINSKKAEACVGNTCYMPEKSASKIVSNHENKTTLAREEESRMSIKGVLSNISMKETNDKSISGLAVAELVQNGIKMVGTSSVVSEERENKLKLGQQGPSHSTERKEKNLNETLATKDRKVDGRLERERELENEHLRKLEEEREREREREREKDRMSLGREVLEAHERSYVQAREQAERTAVERATSEARQRAMSEARERLEKASMEARLRAERTLVERTAVEAWQRAVKKSLVKKNTFEVQEQVERSVTDSFSGPSRCAEMRDTSLTELHDLQFRNTGNLNRLRYSYSSAHFGDEGESPQRCKARLERYQRTAERAAKALAEKNMRDLLAQREQDERNRVAETLNVEVKRWSSGKEGNLRALLSTLQYILGPNSGWQPIPLTEVITSAAVKRAYRKATLCVHPDKLQQRGATIQQKYICEKVFDLLKEAWNMFTSEER